MNNELKLIQEKSLRDEIEMYDDCFYQHHKNSHRYIYKGYRKRRFYLENLVLDLQVKFYWDVKNKKYFYPIYEKYGLELRRRYSEDLRREIARSVIIDNASYRSVMNLNNGRKISLSTVQRWVLEFTDRFSYAPKNTNFNLTKYDNIFICIDDTFRSLKCKSKLEKYRFRVIHFYQKLDDYRDENSIDICLVFKCNDDSNLCMERTKQAINGVLNNCYDHRNLKQKLIVCGDGARYIDTIAQELNAIQILDKFHCFQNIRNVFNFRNCDRNLYTDEAIRMNNFKKEMYSLIARNVSKHNFKLVYELLEKSAPNFNQVTKQRDVLRLLKYIKRHEQNIRNWNLFSFNPTQTETHIQKIVKWRFGAVGKLYSYDIFVKLLTKNCLVFY